MKRPYIVLAVPHNTVVITCDSTEVVCPGNSGQQGGNTIPPPPKGKSYYYLFKHDPNLKAVDDIKGVPQLTGSDLKLSGTRQDFDPVTGEPVVLMQGAPETPTCRRAMGAPGNPRGPIPKTKSLA